jgi:hypothetical protein
MILQKYCFEQNDAAVLLQGFGEWHRMFGHILAFNPVWVGATFCVGDLRCSSNRHSCQCTNLYLLASDGVLR